MTESDPLEKAVKAAEAALSTEKKQVEEEKAMARERTAADQKEIDLLTQERKKILGEMDPKIASEYERIRKGRAGVAIAEVVQGRCSKCNMLLRPQFLQELKRGDAVMVCESCKRMLYVNNPPGVDAATRRDLGIANVGKQSQQQLSGRVARRLGHRRRGLAPTVSGKLPATAPKFFGPHPAACGRSGINCGHCVEKSGGGRAFAAAHVALLKFFAAYDFHRLAIGAPNAGAPFPRFLLKCPHDKSLVLHTLQHRNS